MSGGAVALAATAITNKLAPAATTLSSDSSSACSVTLAESYCLKNFALEDFKSLIGQSFNVKGFFSSVQLRLLDVTSHARPNDKRPAESRNEPFSLQFTTQNNETLRADIHEITNAHTGAFKVFISPIGDHQQSGDRHYEVVFG
jgi:hypothetical protein